MLIDLRTAPEKARNPRPSDMELEVPPAVTPAVYEWMRNTLLQIAGSYGRFEVIEVFCTSGKRAEMAAGILRDAGYRASVMGPVR